MKTPSARFLPIAVALTAAAAALPQAAFAAEEGNKWGIWLDVGRTFNLLLVLGAVVWIARKPLSNFFSGRTHAIQEQLAEAQKARGEAEAALQEMESRMSHLEDELRQIRDSAETEAQQEYRRLLEAAEQDADKIIERSKQEIEGITRAAQLELKIHVAELAVKLAEQQIRSEITGPDQGRLFARFVTQLGGKP